MNTAIICNNNYDKEKFQNRIKGSAIISAEGFIGTKMAISLSQLEITGKILYGKLCDYAFNHGLHYQSLFQNDQYTYISCFIEDISDFKKAFEGEEFLNAILDVKNDQNIEIDHFMVSFPDERVDQ